MATQVDPPLDEIQWTSPSFVQRWGGIHSDNVLFYFHESPFFDQTSNNGFVFKQATSGYNADLSAIVATRSAFEKYLEGINGLEYRVVQDPSNSDAIPTFQHSGVWVIRKQIRTLAGYNKKGEFVPASVQPLSTYFIINENVYMAPTIRNILTSRIVRQGVLLSEQARIANRFKLSISSALNKLVSAASSIPIHNPALGRVYAVPTAKPLTSGASALNTARNSREATPLPEAQLPSFRQGNDASDDDTKDSADPHQAVLLTETLTNSIRHGREYMDEHPLIGEPGNFIIQKSKDVQVSIGKENAAKEKRTLPIPPPLKIDIATEAEKKAKGASTAGGEKSPLSPTGAKKRKKSKIQTPRTPKTPK
ncbi:Mediator of RNA polymerase II transcription subunit 6 [Thelotrema lepadinum]|nr:Mediator of RNA polymerase II transcription subunit 6 [Thelotrema lepadinum]